MTDLRQAAQQVLDALKLSAVTVDSFGVQQATQDAITALKAALEQQAEPVACGYDETTGNCTRELCCRSTQPQRKPLTDEEFCMAWLSIPDPVALGGKFSASKEVRDFVRAIEAAHGIKEEM